MSPLLVALLVSVLVSCALSVLWVSALDRADRLKHSALTPVLPVAHVHIATAWRRKHWN